jgi:5-(carboxyamino)imidazole ribonucleotide mutase
VSNPSVAIVYGSTSDTAVMAAAVAVLNDYGVPFVEAAISAHRAPRILVKWIAQQEEAGVQVFITGAGMSAALPGVVAAHTSKPVIGVPIKGGALDGLDALLAITQMPPGVPVASVGLNAAKNAGVLAVQMLALGDKTLRKKLDKAKDDLESAARDGLGSSK